MQRTITVKGIGKASAKPDCVELSMKLESIDRDYAEAMKNASEKLEALNNSLVRKGFEKSAVKTTDFSVRANYDSVKDKDGNYKSVFKGFLVSHSLKLCFDFDMKRLSEALFAVANCLSNPRISIAFTVRDSSALNEEMLRSATANARRKAEILCEASGGKLGTLISIDYSWGELSIYSDTRYDCCDRDVMPMTASIDIEPDDIDLTDAATFVWEIE